MLKVVSLKKRQQLGGDGGRDTDGCKMMSYLE